MAEWCSQQEKSLMFEAFQPIAAIATTPAGIQRLQQLPQIATLWIPEAIIPHLHPPIPNLQSPTPYSTSLREHLATIWTDHRSFIFCLAAGAVVRLIAPLLQDKATDPAVVVVDEAGKFVISLCGGHQGGADQLTRLIALQLGATPILTGTSNHLNLPAIDTLGVPFGWQKAPGDWTAVSAAIARQLPVQVIQQAGSTLWQQHLPDNHPFLFEPAEPLPQASIQITPFSPPLPLPPPSSLIPPSPLSPSSVLLPPIPSVYWHPRVLWVGIGCERGTARELIEQAVQQVFQEHQFATAAIAGIATLDLKSDEAGLLEFCRDRHLPLLCFSAADLRSIPVPTPSSVVAAEVGTPSVAEAAAILASREQGKGQKAQGKAEGKVEGKRQKVEVNPPSPIPHPQSSPPLPLPPSPPLLVAKQIHRQPGEAGAVTIAVAQAEVEYTGRTGKLWLVGTGPGALEQITPAAQTAIAQADVVIGYSLYIDLIQPLLRPGQIVESLPITQERQRAERAIALAEWGLTVAVVSSGDCGIYGMAGLVLEQLQTAGWDGKTPAVQVFPGITALQSAASRVGAPLMHDFCAISLSDLLTPWEVIETRLTAAAQADFVVALYNPKSQTRREQIAIAQRIFLQYRDPATPVALVRAAYRPDEHITLTTLAEFLTCPIDMLTTVLIGNQSTRTHADWMITPRGYLGFGEGER
jgi:cobalt-precorrin 5A hydrolase/precorrin-3B C17-methyltransferase